MSEPIKPNAGPLFYNTTIPSLADNANIQQALRMYHYGTSDGSIPDDGLNPIASESIASYLGGLQAQLNDIDLGSSYSSTSPELTSSDNGYIWVDSNSAALIFDSGIPTVSFYQNSQPSTGLVEGMLWVDKDSSPLKMYVYDSALGWREIGA